MPGKEGINVGFDHRMYCKVLNEAEIEKQETICERYSREYGVSSSRSSEDDNDEERSDYSEYESESLSSSSAESFDHSASEPAKIERSHNSNKLFDDILGKNINSLCMNYWQNVTIYKVVV